MTQAPPQALGFKNYIVPAWQLRDELTTHIPMLAKQYTPLHNHSRNPSITEDPNIGWREYLCHRVSLITGRPQAAVIRHLYRLMSGESAVCEAELADAMMIACGKLLDHDTKIQTFPGNMAQAREMVMIRAERKGRTLTEAQIERKARRLIEYRARVCYPNGYTPNKMTERYRTQRCEKNRQKRIEKRLARLAAAS